MKTFTQIGSEVAILVEAKNVAYGSSFSKAGDFLRLLFPEGIPPGRYDDMLLLVRIFDKQMRIATDRDALGETPYQDIAGYGVLGVHLHQQKEEDQIRWQGSASAQDAPNSSTDSLASAVEPINSRITTSASNLSANVPLPTQNSCSSKPECAVVRYVPETASPNADVRPQRSKKASRNTRREVRQR